MNVLVISRHRNRLQEWYHVVLPKPDVVEMMMDKVAFYSYAQEKGFPIPATRFLYDRADAEQAARELVFPCVIKPPISALPGWERDSKYKAIRVANPRELLAIYDHCCPMADVLIVQEWVEGHSSNLFSCNCYFDANAAPLATFVARKIRQWPPETGESSNGIECRDDVVMRETIRLFEGVNYYGLGYVEMKRDERSGRYFIMEPNVGRPTGRSAIAEAGGVELLYTMYCDALGLPLPPNRVQKYGDAKWIHLRRDLQSAWYHWRRGNLTIKQWLVSVSGRKAYALFSWNDPGPALGDILRCVRLYLSPHERKKRDYSTPLPCDTTQQTPGSIT
jgi:predicted ATP-grasp superfamily ATP-dependent carboligase